MPGISMKALETEIPLHCRGCLGRSQGGCSVLSPSELVEMARHTHITRRAAGGLLIGEGAPVEAYSTVMRGIVKLSKTTENGGQQLVGLQFAPDFLGRLFGDESQVTIEAATEVQLCVVPRGAFERLVKATPALERRLMQQTLRELDEARDWMVTLGRKSARQKVASLLRLFAGHANVDPNASEGYDFDLPLSRTDIADFLGLTFETVSRQLTLLRLDGVIRVTGGRHVKVPDRHVLHRMCG